MPQPIGRPVFEAVAAIGAARPRTGSDSRAVLPLECRSVSVTRNGRALLRDVSLRVDRGGVTVLMGPNGAGKSMLLRVISNLVRPDSGEVRWAGRAPDPAHAVGLGFVFQRPVMLRRSVLRNVTYVLAAAGVPRAERTRRARAQLGLASLDHLADTPARVLSGGEQQRLAFARALAPRPEALLLDEPTSSLDPASTLAIEQMIVASRDRGTKVVLVTHEVGQARRLADEVVFVHHGRIAERTPAASFFDAPATEPARAFLQGRIVL